MLESGSVRPSTRAVSPGTARCVAELLLRINASGVRSAPQHAVVSSYKYLAELKGMRSKKRAAAGAAASEADSAAEAAAAGSCSSDT
jgi:hypothetical protein